MERGQQPVQFLWLSTWFKRSYIPKSAYFLSFNGRYPCWRTKTMAQMWRCLKELWRNWINLESTIVTYMAKATICRLSRLIRNAKRSSSIPFVLVLPQFIDNGRYPRWTTKTMVQLWRCLKELWRNWINLLLTIVTHMTKATICRLSRLIRNAKRSSSIHSFLFFFNLLTVIELESLSVNTHFELCLYGTGDATTTIGSRRRWL